MDYKMLAGLLLSRSPSPPPSPQKVWNPELTSEINQLEKSELVKAGLHLLNDDLASAHAIAQAHEDPDGNYWHAILHRREGDFGNSRYWYHRVGKHPVWRKMQEVFPRWSAEKFVAECEAGENVGALEMRQVYEIKLLLEHCDRG